MASYPQPNPLAFKASAACAQGKAVKMGADNTHVGVTSAASDKSVGILMNAPSAAEEFAEVAMPGGGAKALLGTGGATRGAYLTPDVNGALVVTTSNGDEVIAQALESGSAGDLIGVMVMKFRY
jgi:hypothetical protein